MNASNMMLAALLGLSVAATSHTAVAADKTHRQEDCEQSGCGGRQ